MKPVQNSRMDISGWFKKPANVIIRRKSLKVKVKLTDTVLSEDLNNGIYW